MFLVICASCLCWDNSSFGQYPRGDHFRLRGHNPSHSSIWSNSKKKYKLRRIQNIPNHSFFFFFFSPGMGRLEKCNWIIFVLFSIDPFLFLDERHRNPSHYESNIHAECGFKCHLQRNVRHIDLITRRVRRIGFVYLLIFSWTWGLFLRLGSSSPWNISICAFIALFYETRKTW